MICQGYKHLEDKKSILPVFPTVSILLAIQKVLPEFNSLLSTKTSFKLQYIKRMNKIINRGGDKWVNGKKEKRKRNDPTISQHQNLLLAMAL